jgi:hypothetical protein
MRRIAFILVIGLIAGIPASAQSPDSNISPLVQSKVIEQKVMPLEITKNVTGAARSPDELHLAWLVSSGNGKWTFLVDGQKIGSEYDEIHFIVFSPDGKHTAFPQRNPALRGNGSW